MKYILNKTEIPGVNKEIKQNLVTAKYLTHFALSNNKQSFKYYVTITTYNLLHKVQDLIFFPTFRNIFTKDIQPNLLELPSLCN